jgi:hypothetical protein
MKRIYASLLLAAVPQVFVFAPAVAATVTDINSTITNAGSCTLTTGCPESYLTANQGSAIQVVNVPPAQSFGFVDSFNQGAGSTNVQTGSNFGAAATGSGAPWNFQDNILFTTNGAQVQAQAIAQQTNVSGLQIRIISLTGISDLQSYVTSSANAATLLGGKSPVVTVQDGWQNLQVGSVDVTATMASPIPAGSYVLQVRGEAASGSTYSGNITFTPVPLPLASWLLLSGMGGMGLLVRRRVG